MLRVALLLFSVTLFAALGCTGCSDSKKAAEPEGPATCSESAPCKAPLVCLDGECADPRVHRGGSNVVTPDKFKKELESINERAEKRNQEALDL